MAQQEPPIEALVFDLDGTLVDSFEDIRRALNSALASAGFAPAGAEQTRKLVGHGPRTLIEASAPRPLTDSEMDALVAEFMAYYGAHLVVATRPYPGMESALDDARRRGLKLAVLSNKPDTLTRGIVAQLGLDGRFDTIAGLAPGGPRKPDPAGLRAIIRNWQLRPEAVVMVGDGETDMAAGRAMGTRLAACLYGARTREQLSPYEPDVWLDQPSDLTRWLQTVNGDR